LFRWLEIDARISHTNVDFVEKCPILAGVDKFGSTFTLNVNIATGRTTL
jgi:hypothetical protein